jgi:hypothetical protein
MRVFSRQQQIVEMFFVASTLIGSLPDSPVQPKSCAGFTLHLTLQTNLEEQRGTVFLLLH